VGYSKKPAPLIDNSKYLSKSKKNSGAIFLLENTTPLFAGNQNPKKIWDIKKFRKFGVGGIIRVYLKVVQKNTPKYLHGN